MVAAVGLMALATATARAATGTFVGERPLLRLRWPAVLIGSTVTPSPTEVIVSAEGRVIRLESHHGAAFLLRRTQASPAGFALLQQELLRWKIGTLSQACRLTQLVGGAPDRLAVPAPGEPIRLTWYGPAGKRTTELVLGSDPTHPVCSQERVNVVGSVIQYVFTAEQAAASFSTGFLPRLASGERRIAGKVRCGASPAGIVARVELVSDYPVECWPEACFRLDPPVLAETTSGANGAFELAIPAAAGGNLWLFAEPVGACATEFGYMQVPPEPLNDVELAIDLIWNPPG
jgi:hypothetical protein